MEFKCPEVSVDLHKAESCYLTKIPAEHDKTPFVDVVSRVLQAGGTPSPCLNDFRGQTSSTCRASPPCSSC